MKVLKIRDVKLPTRASDRDSGIDFYIPNDFVELFYAENCKYTPSEYIEDQDRLKDDNFFIESEAPIINIPAGYGILIPSGLKFLLDPGTDLVLTDKSGVCSKLGLINGACVIDAGYTGEAHIHLINTTYHNIQLTPGQKITQGIIRKVDLTPVFECDEAYYEIESRKYTDGRGDGGFGSTDKK